MPFKINSCSCRTEGSGGDQGFGLMVDQKRNLKIPLGGEIIIGLFIIDISYEKLLGLTKTKSDSVSCSPTLGLWLDHNIFISSLQIEGI